MGSQLWRAIRTVARWIGYAAAYFADVPDFLEWLLGIALAVIATAAQEPIGSLALACAIGILTVVWMDRRGPPIL
jgi:predicted outer membrane lipoprotein